MGLSSGSAVVATGGGLSLSGGQRFPIIVAIGSLAGVLAGVYTDSITVTVVSTE